MNNPNSPDPEEDQMKEVLIYNDFQLISRELFPSYPRAGEIIGAYNELYEVVEVLQTNKDYRIKIGSPLDVRRRVNTFYGERLV